MESFFRRVRNQSGQGMTEYIIIVALIAIAAIAAFSYFGGAVRNQTAAMTEEISGQSGTDQIKSKGAEIVTGAQGEADKKYSLESYTEGQDKLK